MPLDLNKEKLRCVLVLEDRLAKRLSPTAGPAYWGGFIVEDRETHVVSAIFRFAYENGNRNWFGLKVPKELSSEDAVGFLRCVMEDVVKKGLDIFGLAPTVANNAIHCWYPPDDGGDPAKTLIWLEQQDLVEIEVKRADEVEEADGESNLHG